MASIMLCCAGAPVIAGMMQVAYDPTGMSYGYDFGIDLATTDISTLSNVTLSTGFDAGLIVGVFGNNTLENAYFITMRPDAPDFSYSSFGAMAGESDLLIFNYNDQGGAIASNDPSSYYWKAMSGGDYAGLNLGYSGYLEGEFVVPETGYVDVYLHKVTKHGRTDYEIEASVAMLRISTTETIINPQAVGPLATLTVSPDTATLAEGATQQFTVTGQDAEGDPVSPLPPVTWTVNGGIGTIDAEGLFTAAAAGTGSVTATVDTVSDTSGEVVVTAPQLATLTVSPDTATLAEGATQQFTVTGQDAEGDPISPLPPVTWTVNGGIGTIDADGLFTATAAGTGSVTATAGTVSDSSGTISVTAIQVPVKYLIVSPETASLVQSTTQQFTVTAKDADGSTISPTPAVTWSVEGGIGTIGADGLFTATTVGSGSVKAAIGDVYDYSGQVVVTAGAVATLIVTPETATLAKGAVQPFSVIAKDAVGNPVTLTAAVTWTVNGGIGTIGADGLFTATTAGTGSVTATLGTVNGTSGTVVVTAPQLVSLTVSPDTATLARGATRQFTVTGKDAGGNPVSPLPTVTWAVNGEIGTISADGLFTAATEGTGSVTATVGTVSDTSGDVVVTAPQLALLTVSPDTASVYKGATQQFTVTGKDTAGDPISPLPAVTWTVNGGIGTIGADGLFTATTVGTGSVRATVGMVSDTSGSVGVIEPQVASLTVSPDAATLVNGAAQQFTVTAKDASGNTISPAPAVTWTVNGGIGTIGAGGLFTATTEGTGSVTATMGAVSDTSGDVVVTTVELAALTVSPDTADLVRSAIQQFTVTGKDPAGNPILPLPPITWTVNGGIGTISAGGLFTATADGTGSVTATVGAVSDTSGSITVSGEFSISVAGDQTRLMVSGSTPDRVVLSGKGGSAGGYRWALSGVGSFSQNSLMTTSSSDSVTFYAPATVAGESQIAAVTLTDANSPSLSDTVFITVYPKITIIDKPAVPPLVEAGATSSVFGVQGGDGAQYTWRLKDPAGATVETAVGTTYSFQVPQGEAFAGVYTVTVTDGSGFADSFPVMVPIELDPATSVFTETNLDGTANDRTFTVSGADGDYTWEILAAADAVTAAAVPEAYGTWADSSPVAGNPVNIFAPANVVAIERFFIRVTVANDEDLTAENGLNQRVFGPFTIIPVAPYTVTVTDTAQVAVQGAAVSIDYTDPCTKTEVASKTTNDRGEAYFTLPDTGGTYAYTAAAAGYVTAEVQSALNLVQVQLPEVGPLAIEGSVEDIGGAPLGGARVTAYQPGDVARTYAAVTTPDGFYTIGLPALGAPMNGWTVVAEFEGHDSAAKTDSAVGTVNFVLEPETDPDAVRAFGSGEWTFGQNGQTVKVAVPVGGLSRDAVIVISQVPIGDALTPETQASPSYIYEVMALDHGTWEILAEELINRVKITLPIDLAVVGPGQLESGAFSIFKADSLPAIEAGAGYAVPPANIIRTDYIGDGRIGSVTFWVENLSVFSVGTPDTGAEEPSGGDNPAQPGSSGGGGGCFIATAAGGPPHEAGLLPGAVLVLALMMTVAAGGAARIAKGSNRAK